MHPGARRIWNGPTYLRYLLYSPYLPIAGTRGSSRISAWSEPDQPGVGRDARSWAGTNSAFSSGGTSGQALGPAASPAKLITVSDSDQIRLALASA